MPMARSLRAVVGAALLAAAAAAAYAPGICQDACGAKRPFSDANNLPGEVCNDMGPCGALTFPGSTPKRNTTRCVADFEQSCASQRGCAGCALWRSVETCGTPQQREECLARPTYVLMRTLETIRGTGEPCRTAKHWILVPKIPCTGVESPDPACTGAEGEQWWAAAFVEATQHLNYSLAADAASWAIMVGSAVWRSQHQMHLRIDDLDPEVDMYQELRQLAAAGNLSTNASEPTIFYSAESAGRLAVVYVPAPWTPEAIAQTVRPWSTAARLAEADPAPHGVLLAPLTAPASDGSGNNTPGFVVAAVLDTNSGQLQVEGKYCNTAGTELGSSSSAPSSGGRRHAARMSAAPWLLLAAWSAAGLVP